MNYTWVISNIDATDVEDQENVIRSFTWTITAEKDGQSASYSSLYVSSEGLEEQKIFNFTEFASLQKDQCIAWVTSGLGIELDAIKENLAREVKSKIAAEAKNIVSAPW